MQKHCNYIHCGKFQSSKTVWFAMKKMVLNGLKNCRVFTYFFLFLNKRSTVHFCRCGGLWVTQLVIFGGRHKCIIPKWFKTTTNSVIRGSIVSSSTSSQIHFDCHITVNNPQFSLPPFHWWSNQKTCFTFSCYLIVLVKKIVA